MTVRKIKHVTKRDRKRICKFLKAYFLCHPDQLVFPMERDLNLNSTSSGVTVTESNEANYLKGQWGGG